MVTPLKSLALYGLLPLTAIFLTEPIYRRLLFDLTLKDIPAMQSFTGLKGYFDLMTLLGEFWIIILVLCIIFNISNILTALYIWMSLSMISFF
jgi:hypothetical protein